MKYSIENKDNIFFKLLGIENPWIIEKIETDNKESLHIYVSFDKKEKFECPVCHLHHAIYDVENKTFKYLNLFQYQTFIHCKVPVIKCNNEIHLVKIHLPNLK